MELEKHHTPNLRASGSILHPGSQLPSLLVDPNGAPGCLARIAVFSGDLRPPEFFSIAEIGSKKPDRMVVFDGNQKSRRDQAVDVFGELWLFFL